MIGLKKALVQAPICNVYFTNLRWNHKSFRLGAACRWHIDGAVKFDKGEPPEDPSPRVTYLLFEKNSTGDITWFIMESRITQTLEDATPPAYTFFPIQHFLCLSYHVLPLYQLSLTIFSNKNRHYKMWPVYLFMKIISNNVSSFNIMIPKLTIITAILKRHYWDPVYTIKRLHFEPLYKLYCPDISFKI